MSSIEPVRRSVARCVVNPIWRVCQCSFTLDHKLLIDPRMWMRTVTGGGETSWLSVVVTRIGVGVEKGANSR